MDLGNYFWSSDRALDRAVGTVGIAGRVVDMLIGFVVTESV